MHTEEEVCPVRGADARMHAITHAHARTRTHKHTPTHSHPQKPAPFVVLSRRLHVAVSYNSKVLDASCPGVADRLRKQAKTRAVKILREVPYPSISKLALYLSCRDTARGTLP